MAYQMKNGQGGGPQILGEHRSAPRLRLKPSSSTLRSTSIPRGPSGPRPIIASTTASPHPFNFARSNSDLSIPRLQSPVSTPDATVYGRKDRRPSSSLPKPMTPVERMPSPSSSNSREAPPTKQHAAFSIGAHRNHKPASVSSTDALTESSKSSPEKKRRVLRRKDLDSSSSQYNAYAPGPTVRRGSNISFNASTTSLTTSDNSFYLIDGSTQDVTQSSVLGITLPATSASTNSSLAFHQRKLSGSASVPRLLTQDIPPPANSGIDSSPSTRYTSSPGAFSYISTPTSVSSHSPGPSLMFKTRSNSPNRARTRSGGSAVAESTDIIPDAARESTASTSSTSTIKASEQETRRTGYAESKYTRPPSPPIPREKSQLLGSVSAPTSPFLIPSKSPRLAPSPFPRTPPQTSLASCKGSFGPGVAQSSKETTGLGLNIPTASVASSSMLMSGGVGLSIPRSRNRSVSTSQLNQRPKKEPETSPSPAQVTLKSTVPRGVAVSPAEIAHIIPPPSKASRPAPPPPLKTTEIPSGSSNPKSAPPTTRLGFFSRVRNRANSTSEEKAEKPVRRGPAAGTGHEGYGSFSKMTRGRSGSISSGSKARSGSQGSITSKRTGSRPGSRGSAVDADMDDYLAERLKPVVIVGGEVVDNQNLTAGMETDRSVSAQSFSRRRPSAGSLMSKESTSEGSLKVLAKAEEQKGTAIASRRLQRKTQGHIPAPINVAGRKTTTPLPSPSAASVRSVATSTRKPSFDRHDSSHAELPPPKAKTRRWNFLRRDTGSSQRLNTSTPPPAVDLAHKKSISRKPAHYALLDQDEEREAAELSERLQSLRQQAMTPLPGPPSPYTLALRQQQSVHASSAPLVASATPSSSPQQNISTRDDSVEQAKAEVRQAMANERKRLQEVGQKLRTQSEDTKEIDVSVSKHKLEVPLPESELSKEEKQGESAPQEGEISETRKASAEIQEFQINWDSYGLTPTDAIRQSTQERSKDFFEYDPLDIRGRRMGSVESVDKIEESPSVSEVNKSPSVTWSLSNGHPAQTLETVAREDETEVWDEYDDFLDDKSYFGLLSGPSIVRTNTVRSTTSSLGAPFQYSDHCSGRISIGQIPKLNEETEDTEAADIKTSECARDSPTLPASSPSKAVPELPTLEESLPVDHDTRIPSSPFSLSSFIRGYGESSSRVASLAEMPSIALLSSAEQTKTHKSKASTGSSGSSNSSGSVGTVDEMKVRPWALLASRWLSFGRVLVSPAHEQLQHLGDSEGGRVLVVDGLGTDDWSFYCALSYPSAKVYNLTQSPSPSSGSTSPYSPSVPRPANHHQAHHPSFANTSFPFPKGFFNVVSFRFLPSSEGAHWSLIISECKRVLQPGGYLEVTVLDSELMNPGPRATRAVDLVKAIMERESDDGSFRRRKHSSRPVSEKVLKMLPKKGFEDISKCFVALPVVGKVNGSISLSGSTGSLLEQTAREPSPDDPEAISDVISKVGRWWYTNCYERVITGEGEAPGRSMWNERGLLKECQRKGTNFKMMICHARRR